MTTKTTAGARRPMSPSATRRGGVPRTSSVLSARVVARTLVALITAVGCGGDGEDGGEVLGPTDTWDCPEIPSMAPVPTVVAEGISAPASVAIAGDVAWFGAHAGGWVGRVELASGSDPQLVLAVSMPTSVAADDSYVYVATAGGEILRAEIESLAFEVIATGQARPHSLRLHEGSVLWVNAGTMAGDIHQPEFNFDAGVARVAASGGPVEILLTGGAEARGLAVDDRRAWVAIAEDGRGRIVELSLDDEIEPRTLLTEAGAIQDLAAYDGTLYWTRPLACSIRSFDLTDKVDATIVDAQSYPMHLVADALGLAWTNYGPPSLQASQASEIMAAGHDGAGAHAIVRARRAWALAADGSAGIYGDNELDSGAVSQFSRE